MKPTEQYQVDEMIECQVDERIEHKKCRTGDMCEACWNEHLDRLIGRAALEDEN